MKLLAIDPGETVGWAVGWNAINIDNGPSVFLADWGQFPSDDLDENLDAIFGTWDVEGAAIERPSMRPRTGGDDSSREVGRVIANRLEERGVWIVWQTASQAKGVMHDERLKAMGFYRKGKPHARDAIRHLIIATRSKSV